MAEKGGDLVDKKDILQFEKDDASQMGINGKQVFFAKRINGQISRNKGKNETTNNKLKQNDLEEDLFIEFKNPYVDTEDSYRTKKSTKGYTNDGKNNYRIKSSKDRKKAKNKEKNNKQKTHNTNQRTINKKKSKKNKNRKNRKIIALFLIIFAMIIFALISPIFNIQTINIEGNDKVNSDTIISLSGVETGDNIFRISERNIINNIKENTYIESVAISRNLPGTLEISVKERKVAYQIKVINSYVYIDSQGYILEKNSKSANVPIIEGFSTDQNTLLNSTRISNNDIPYLNTLLKIMNTAKKEEFSNLITKIIIENDEYILELESENKKVYLGDSSDIVNKMAYLKVILKQEKGNTGEVFLNDDLNNGFKPFFREEIKEEENKRKENEEENTTKNNK